jgi:signal transduction histidine kinase
MQHLNDPTSPAAENREYDLRLSRIAELLREPLASIYGFAELLLTQDYDEELRHELTATLLDQVEAMSNIINAQLDIRNSGHSAAPALEPAMATGHVRGGPA